MSVRRLVLGGTVIRMRLRVQLGVGVVRMLLMTSRLVLLTKCLDTTLRVAVWLVVLRLDVFA